MSARAALKRIATSDIEKFLMGVGWNPCRLVNQIKLALLSCIRRRRDTHFEFNANRAERMKKSVSAVMTRLYSSSSSSPNIFAITSGEDALSGMRSDAVSFRVKTSFLTPARLSKP